MRTGSLWLTIGLHLAWNWFEGFIWGQPVSGFNMGTALFRRTASESEFWTGGDFGPEASGVTAICLCVCVAATVLVRRRPTEGLR